MPRLSWTSSALQDLRRIESHLEAEASPAVATRILVAIREKAELLRSFPHAGPPVRDTGFRVLRISRTPYLLVYRLLESGIQILRVHHERQNWHMEA